MDQYLGALLFAAGIILVGVSYVAWGPISAGACLGVGAFFAVVMYWGRP